MKINGRYVIRCFSFKSTVTSSVTPVLTQLFFTKNCLPILQTTNEYPGKIREPRISFRDPEALRNIESTFLSLTYFQ